MLKVMAVNAGSSSLKFQLIEMPSEVVITSGLVERIGLDSGHFKLEYQGNKYEVNCPIKDHDVAVSMLLEGLVEHKVVEKLSEINAVGHRVVQGGDFFNDSVKVNPEYVAKVVELAELAPLHNKAAVVGYTAFKNALPNVDHVFVFDTSFHQTLDEERYLYPIPYEYYEKYSVRKYGAHGTSHKYVANEAIKMLGNPDSSKIIICHLGNGASVSAVKDGKCIDTSMGFTPLAGLMMGTRSGDVDPSVIPFLCKKLNTDAQGIIDIFNHKSGMLGVSGVSSDSRDVEAAYNNNDARAIITCKLYSRIVSKYIGSYVMELGGVDAIAFTAGVGENASFLREMIIDNVSEALNIVLDNEVNNTRAKGNRVISKPNSKVEIMVIPTNEEIMIARDTVRILGL